MRLSEVVKEAQGVLGTATDHYPTPESTMFVRVSIRMKQLFHMAAEWDPEYYGVCTVVTWENNRVDFDEVKEARLWPVARVTEVHIEDGGTSGFTKGTRVNVVMADDFHAHMPPRALLRSHILEGVLEDMDDVKSLRVWYTRTSRDIDREGRVDGEDDPELELEDPWSQLLVWDLARDLVRRTLKFEGGDDTKKMLLEMIHIQERQLLQAFRDHIASFATARQDRF